jgi:hypothetical protein
MYPNIFQERVSVIERLKIRKFYRKLPFKSQGEYAEHKKNQVVIPGVSRISKI